MQDSEHSLPDKSQRPERTPLANEALAFIHGPGMVLTAILASAAFKQEQAGEKVHGIASAHGAVAATTAIAYGASIIAVSWPIHLKFWEKQ